MSKNNARPSRIAQEQRTVEQMIRLYCRKKEGNKELCPQCLELLEYARVRLSRCPFGEKKNTCRLCPIHCYKPAMKERMREVMPGRECCSITLRRHSGIYGRSIYINISANASDCHARNSTNSRLPSNHTLPKKLRDLWAQSLPHGKHIRADALRCRSRQKKPPLYIGGISFYASSVEVI